SEQDGGASKCGPGAESGEEAEAETSECQLLDYRRRHGDGDEAQGELRSPRAVPEHWDVLVRMGTGADRGRDNGEEHIGRRKHAEDQAEGSWPRSRPAERNRLPARQATRDQEYEPEQDRVLDKAADAGRVTVEGVVALGWGDPETVRG